MSARRVSQEKSHRRRRSAVVVIEDPRIVVVESATVANPAAVDGALELLVKWAVRAHKLGHPVPAGAPSDENTTTSGSGN